MTNQSHTELAARARKLADRFRDDDFMADSDVLTSFFEQCATALEPPERVQGEPITVESIRAAGGIVHSDGNIFFTNIDKLRAALLASSPADTREPVDVIGAAMGKLTDGQIRNILD